MLSRCDGGAGAKRARCRADSAWGDIPPRAGLTPLLARASAGASPAPL
jgi:hypothetical protein